ncbi:NERD domain-containing protein [Anabaena sp. FACHB-1237]|uniref:nuclease-related domain-containing DEAD/DEAH box helicase n=1 Tax=Anabaena sp. FACHB-1237 TaxID=2692769 RepID=UPI001680816A|nr:NERD domain-containing protein [Anabaena sp. FACHB-1237]MBD2136024.1 NERD domain-containing protein [Anabaena sp. FACHB-1237]
MAIFFPSDENISRLKVPPTTGEEYLLNFLHRLSDEYEIYYQPFLNGDQPDIIIMRKNYGVMIIEVKDWHLSYYYIDKNKKWRLKTNDSIIKSPISQVKTYKENLYDLHIENLLEKKIDNPKFFGLVSCAVYFHNETQETIKKFIDNNFESESDRRFIKIFGNDSINPQKFHVILSEQGLSRRSLLFDDNLYNSFKRYLQPSLHTIEQGIKIQFNKEQQKLVTSIPTKTGRKIKGVAGSGKTHILAQRAVNAHKRTDSKVLILTYNITLKNYIRDKINDVRQEFNWRAFDINNYHNFLTTQLNNLGIEWEIPGDFENWSSEERTEYLEKKYYSNETIFEPVKGKIQKYQIILIDEIQDYKEEWQRIIRKYFWDNGGEYVVFGDVKQNIYDLPLDEYKDFKAVGIGGVWNVLKESFRLTTKVANIATEFQKTFFSGKYNLDEITQFRQKSIFEAEEYYQYIYYDKSVHVTKIVDDMYSLIIQLNKHPNDICFLSQRIEIIRQIDYTIRNNKHEKTKAMFESQEIHEKLKMESSNKYANLEIKKIRNNKKIHFWMNPGTVKLSTIHSFKGWEIDTLFLIIEDDYDEDSESAFSIDELIYTGLTRCRNNLIVVNISNQRYHDFFKGFIEEDIV